MTATIGEPCRTFTVFFAIVCFAVAPVNGQQTDTYQIAERGQDFAIYNRVRVVTNALGELTVATNQFTLMENYLNYFENGQWKESEDVIETTTDGAIALRGPNKAIFSPDLNAPAAFDILMPDGRRLRGGVRAIQLTDVASGRNVTLATLKASAPGELLPPDQILYPDAFDGLKADVLVNWKHNYFGHDIVFREQPALPEGMSPDTTRLEILTELIDAPPPEIRKQTVRAGTAGALEDHVVIHFGRLAFVMGKAFRVTNDVAWAVGGLNASDAGVPVLKQWQTLPDGRTFLVESIAWTEAQPQLRDLPAATGASASPDSKDKTALARQWPEPPKARAKAKPMQVARLGYQPQGFVVDFVIIPDQGTPTTLASGQTYYIKTSYYSGQSVTVEPGCFIKFKNNAYMLLYGPVSFPSAAPKAVFTSRNDNSFGEVIQGVSGETDSNGDPTLHKAAEALWIYYVDFNTTIRNIRIRWAQSALRYDSNPGVCPTHTVRDSQLEYCPSGISLNFSSCYDSTILSLINVTKCVVGTPITLTGDGIVDGSMSDDCEVVSIARVNDPAQDSASGDPNKNSQSECSFVVVDANRIVASFFDTHLSEYGLGAYSLPGITSPRSTGWAVSVNGGASFTDKGAIPAAAPAYTTQGDAGDPVMARDTASGAIYLLVNPSRESSTWKGFRLWKSTDNGETFFQLKADIFGALMSQGDKDAIAVNNFSGLGNSGHLYAAGSSQAGNQLWVGHSANGGVNWDGIINLSDPAQGWSPDIAIRPNGAVYVFYLTWTGTYVNSIIYKWLNPGQTTWNTPAAGNLFKAHTDSDPLYSTKSYASGDPLRFKTASQDDFFISNGFPRVAVNPSNGRIYVVFADLPGAGSTTDRGDIWINEGIPNADNSLTWTGARKVNNDGTATDQWNPSIAINPAGTMLFVGYYSRQEDAANNALIRAYGAKASLVNGLATATFDVFPISASAFSPLFPGTTASTPPANTWMYDHVWVQTGVCFDRNAYLVDCASPNYFFGPVNSPYQHFMADDYTWASADGSYFYYAWCDRSDTYSAGGNSRPDPNIRLGKIRQ
jgi:hypothetical protein